MGIINISNLNPRDLGRLNKALDKMWNFNGAGISTFRKLINEGRFSAKKTGRPCFNRRYYNSLTGDDQERYEKSLESKTVYMLVEPSGTSREVSKIIYDCIVFGD